MFIQWLILTLLAIKRGVADGCGGVKNDGVCDCADGSDEPDTGACPDAVYTCPNHDHRQQSVYGWQRNDGVCDCCDGSDEPAGHCPNTCAQLARLEEEKREREQRTRLLGVALKQQLSIQARSINSEDYRQVFSQLVIDRDLDKAVSAIQYMERGDCQFDNWLNSVLRIFHSKPTSTVTVTVTGSASSAIKPALWSSLPECFQKTIGKYQYELCPFDRVSQIEGGSIVSLGSFKSINETAMSFGGGTSCWGHSARQSVVWLECGDNVGEISSVDEQEKCSYRIVFKTCLAC